MLGSVVPGFKSHGSPVKQFAAEERRRYRERRRERDNEYAEAVRRHESRPEAERWADEAATAAEVVDDPTDWEPPRNDLRAVDDRDPKIRRPYTPREEAEMESIRSPRYRGDDPEHHHSVPGARDAWEAAERLGSVAPVMGNPSLDPAAGDLVAVSYMAGYADDAAIGHSAIQGVDRMVTGEVDATRELETPSATAGTPLQLAPHESPFDDSRGLGTHDLRLGPTESGEAMSWTSELRMYEAEPEHGGRLDPDDWCSCVRADDRDEGWL